MFSSFGPKIHWRCFLPRTETKHEAKNRKFLSLAVQFLLSQGLTESQIPPAEEIPSRQTVPLLLLHEQGLPMSSCVVLTHLCQLPHSGPLFSMKIVQT